MARRGVIGVHRGVVRVGKVIARDGSGTEDAWVADLRAAEVHAHYGRGLEQTRLDGTFGVVEYARTIEIISRVLPPPPASVADIGGGPGRYALWLAEAGYRVRHRDLVPLHVDQVTEASEGRVEAAVADARALDLADACVDAVLLLGPIYHLDEPEDRLAALAEAARIARPGAPILISAISRWAPRLDGYLTKRLYREHAEFAELVARVESDGRLPPASPGAFSAYCHTPDQLRREVEAAGLVVEDLVGVEGVSFALADLAERLADPVDRQVVLDSARALERVPELLGLSPHLIATARPG
jgi:SAM-dependent methyltransferase